MEYKFFISDLQTLAKEYEGRVPPREIRLILQYVNLEDINQARQALDLYHTDESTRKTIDDFIREGQKRPDGKLF